MNLELFLNIFTIYYQAMKRGGGEECLSGHYLKIIRNLQIIMKNSRRGIT